METAYLCVRIDRKTLKVIDTNIYSERPETLTTTGDYSYALLTSFSAPTFHEASREIRELLRSFYGRAFTWAVIPNSNLAERLRSPE